MRSKLFHLLTLAASLALCAACAESLDPGNALDKPQPLVFSAAQGDLTLSTRAAADGSWDGDGTEYVAIQVGGEVKKYKVISSDGALEPADGETPFYRSDTGDIEVTAWYPYSDELPAAPSIATDQRTKENREASNLMTATATAKFRETTTLTFSHQTALIKVSIIGEDGSTPVTDATVNFIINSTTITAFYDTDKKIYSALISPGTIGSGTEFISITKDSKNYVYKLASETTFSAGNSYAYSLTLEEPGDYFYVEAAETVTGGITVSMTSNSGPGINLLYSTDGTNWENFTVGSTTVTLSKTGDKVWFKAGKVIDGTVTSVKNTQLSSGYEKYNNFTFKGGKVNIGGDITTLLSDSGGVSDLSDPSSDGSANATYTFYKLFSGNTGLISAENLSLPSAILANDCYRELFSGCTSLTGVPALSATSLAERCYMGLFQGCTKLTTAPKLNAATLFESCYYQMFSGCTYLTAAPDLNATELAMNCYYEMFKGCEKLTKAPELPATTLAHQCYLGMFQGCTSLIAAPNLDATTLAESCYSYMFQGCTNLKNGPSSLPATELFESCYCKMFYGCEALETAPTISAESLAYQCCQWMFQNCTNLTAAPELPAESLAKQCYYGMFFGCTNLTSAPELPATTLASSCYYQMFYGCTSLTIAPDLPATDLVYYCYSQMFSGCTNLTSVTIKATTISSDYALENWLPEFSSDASNPTRIIYKSKNLDENTLKSKGGIPDGWKCDNYDEPKGFYVEAVTAGATVSMTSNSGPTIYLRYSTDGTTWKDFTVGSTEVTLSNAGDKVWFKAGSEADESKTNTQLSTSSRGSYSTNDNTKCNKFSFSGEVNIGGDLTSLLSPDGGAVTLSDYAFCDLFSGCTTLKSAEKLSLPSTTLAKYCYSDMFNGCTQLTTPPIISAATLKNYCCYRMFYGCSSLTTAPELKATELALNCYYYMFYNCESLATAPELPATTLKGSCYKYMFYGCTNLTKGPVLPATTLASNCYDMMFYNCKKLSEITVKATTTASSAFFSWLSLDGMTKENTGIIYYYDDSTLQILTDASAIPTGWTASQLTN